MASPALKSAHPLKTTPKGRRLRELYTPNHSAVHRIDARVKVIFTLAFIVFLNLTPSGAWPAYVLFFTWMFSLSLSSRLGIVFVLKRSLLALPFVLAALPLVFTGPAPLGHISVLNAPPLTYSVVGFYRFASIAIKAWVSVMAAVLLAATTRFPDLLTAFSQLKVPTLFITIIGLMWRYLFVISDEVTRMLRARTSRSATAPRSNRSGGSLFWRARVTGAWLGICSCARLNAVTGYTPRCYPEGIQVNLLLRKQRGYRKKTCLYSLQGLFFWSYYGCWV